MNMGLRKVARSGTDTISHGACNFIAAVQVRARPSHSSTATRQSGAAKRNFLALYNFTHYYPAEPEHCSNRAGVTDSRLCLNNQYSNTHERTKRYRLSRPVTPSLQTRARPLFRLRHKPNQNTLYSDDPNFNTHA